MVECESPQRFSLAGNFREPLRSEQDAGKSARGADGIAQLALVHGVGDEAETPLRVTAAIIGHSRLSTEHASVFTAAGFIRGPF